MPTLFVSAHSGHPLKDRRRYRIGLVRDPCSDMTGYKVSGRLESLPTSMTLNQIARIGSE